MATWTVHPTPERELELERLGNEIAELAAHLNAATARLLDLIREFDARGGWGNGFSSCAAWLTWRVGLAPGAARASTCASRALGTLPRLAQALARGELSYSKVRALTRVATSETEERLLALGRAGTAQHVERIIRAWRYVDRKAEIRDTARRHARRMLHLYPDDDGMVVVRGRLEPEVGAVLMKALEAARETLYAQARAGTALRRTFLRERLRGAFPKKRRCSNSSRRTRSRWSPRQRFTTASTPALRPSGTRSWSMSTPRCSRMPMRPASPCSRAAPAFLRRRLSAWPAMRAARSATRYRRPDRRGRHADANDSARASPRASLP